MATSMSDNLGVREGLIQIVSAERFRNKPHSGEKTHVVVMEKVGSTLHHYRTLWSRGDQLSFGEKLWGNFVCYVVDLSSRELRISEEFETQDLITKVRVVADIRYRAINGEQVAIGVDDALRSLRDDFVAFLRRQIRVLPLEEVAEASLEARLGQNASGFPTRLGIAVEGIRIAVEWPEDLLKRRREERERARIQSAQKAQEQYEWEREDQVRRRHEKLELEDIAHINRLMQELGLAQLPPDFRARLASMPREQALQQIIAEIGQQRDRALDIYSQRMQEESTILKKLIDNGVLEDMDLVDFGKQLMGRYQRGWGLDQAIGMPLDVLFGGSRRPEIDEGRGDPGRLPDSSSSRDDDTAHDNPDA